MRNGEGIGIGTATDPYQPVERRHQLTRSILEVLAQASGHRIGIVTKSNLIVRDIDVFTRIHERNDLRLHLTVTTTDTTLARKLEPRAPRPDLRLEAVRRLRDAGLHAGVLCCPVLPRITDNLENLESVVRAAKQAGANFVSANAVYFSSSSLAVYMPFIREHFPQFATFYEQHFQAAEAGRFHQSYVSKEYAERLRARVKALCRKHQILQRDEYESCAKSSGAQLSLFARP